MQYLDKPFDVNTGSGRRPTPLVYVHLRKWVEKDEKYLELRSQTDLTNVNQQFDDSAKYYVSNVIQRTISQLIGATEKGFATIKATEDGELKVYIDDRIIDAIEELKTEIALAEGSNLIGKVQIAGTSQAPLNAEIDFNTAATHDIIAAAAGKAHHITTIVLTVGGETNLTFKDETGNITGPLDFGGTDEPRGMVSNHVLVPLKCTISEKFQIISSGAVQVSGYVIYFDE